MSFGPNHGVRSLSTPYHVLYITYHTPCLDYIIYAYPRTLLTCNDMNWAPQHHMVSLGAIWRRAQAAHAASSLRNVSYEPSSGHGGNKVDAICMNIPYD